MTTVGPDVDLDDHRLPAPGTDEGRAALAAEAARHGHPDPQAYVAAYQEALAAARGVAEEIHGEGQHPPDGPVPGGGSPFSPPANFTADGHVVEYGPDGTSMVTNDFRTLPDGVDHYDRYTGEPLDAEGHARVVVPVDDFPGDVPGPGADGTLVTNEYHDLDDGDPPAVGEVPPAVTQPDPGPSFGQGDTTTDDVPDPRVTTTAEDLGPSSSDEEPDEESGPAAEIGETTVGSDDAGAEEDGSPEFDTDPEPA